MKNFLSKPITWGSSLKVSAIFMGLTVLVGAIYYAATFGGLLEKLTDRFGK